MEKSIFRSYTQAWSCLGIKTEEKRFDKHMAHKLFAKVQFRSGSLYSLSDARLLKMIHADLQCSMRPTSSSFGRTSKRIRIHTMMKSKLYHRSFETPFNRSSKILCSCARSLCARSLVCRSMQIVNRGSRHLLWVFGDVQPGTKSVKLHHGNAKSHTKVVKNT